MLFAHEVETLVVDVKDGLERVVSLLAKTTGVPVTDADGKPLTVAELLTELEAKYFPKPKLAPVANEPGYVPEPPIPNISPIVPPNLGV